MTIAFDWLYEFDGTIDPPENFLDMHVNLRELFWSVHNFDHKFVQILTFNECFDLGKEHNTQYEAYLIQILILEIFDMNHTTYIALGLIHKILNCIF